MNKHTARKLREKHGIEVRYGKGAKLRLLSYAVYNAGICQVSHGTTAHLRKQGHDLAPLVEREQNLAPLLPII